MKSKLLTACAFAVISSASFALEDLTEEVMSNATGQDGFTVALAPSSTGSFKMKTFEWYDKDGFTGITGLTAKSGGALELGGGGTGVTINTAGGSIVTKIDADGGASAATLNVNIQLPSTFSINTGNIGVGTANRNNVAGTTATTGWGLSGGYSQILDPMDISLGGATVNMQLGAQPQGALINIAATITNGIQIGNLKVKDNAGGGQLGITKLTIMDDNTSNLSVMNAPIKLTTSGLELSYNGNWMNLLMEDVRVGNTSSTASSLGDMRIQGLNMNGTKLTITGH